MPDMQVSQARNKRSAERRQEEGFEPIECRYDQRVVLGPLQMSRDRGGLVQRSLQFPGSRADAPFFVVRDGTFDPDVALAIEILAGRVNVAGVWTSVPALAKLIDAVVAGRGPADLTDTDAGCVLLAWQLAARGARRMLQACRCFEPLLGPERPADLIEAAIAEEKSRVGAALDHPHEQISGHVALVRGNLRTVMVGAALGNYDIWFRTLAPYDYGAWFRDLGPVIVVYEPCGAVLLVVQSPDHLGTLFGEGGLEPVASELKPDGWQSTSPLTLINLSVSYNEALAAAKLVADRIAAHVG